MVLIKNLLPQILSSRKTRIKTKKIVLLIHCVFLRYYPPEKQGLRRILAGVSASICRLRYYPPEKQGLRLAYG